MAPINSVSTSRVISSGEAPSTELKAKPSQAKPSIDTYKEVAISLTSSVCYGIKAAIDSTIAALDIRTYLRFLDSSSKQVPDVLDVALGLNSFENAFPTLDKIISNPRKE